MVMTSTFNDLDFDKVAEALIKQHALRESIHGSQKGKGKGPGKGKERAERTLQMKTGMDLGRKTGHHMREKHGKQVPPVTMEQRLGKPAHPATMDGSLGTMRMSTQTTPTMVQTTPTMAQSMQRIHRSLGPTSLCLIN